MVFALGDNVKDKWILDINETQKTEVGFPIIADKSREIATAFDMLDHQGST